MVLEYYSLTVIARILEDGLEDCRAEWSQSIVCGVRVEVRIETTESMSAQELVRMPSPL